MSVRIAIAMTVLLGRLGASVWAAPPSSVDQMEKRLGHEASIPDLVKGLQSKDAHVRALAASALQELGPDAAEAVVPLIAALKDRSAHVRGNAASALVCIGPRATAATTALIKALKDGNGYVRRRAAFALGTIGTDPKTAVPALIQTLKDNDDKVSWAALHALGKLGPAAAEAIPALRQLVRRGSQEAAEALGKMGPLARAAIPDLTKMLNDKPAKAQAGCNGDDEKRECVHSRVAAALALWQIHHQAGVIPMLIDILKDKDHLYAGDLSDVRQHAAIALGKIGREARAAVPLLIMALRDKDDSVGEAAAGALGAIGPDAQAAAAALGKLVRKDGWVREEAADALGKLGSGAKAAIPGLIRVARPRKNEGGVEGWADGQESGRIAACRALWRIERKADHVLPGLLETLRVQDIHALGPRFYRLQDAARLRRNAAEVLGTMGKSAKDAMPALKALSEKDRFLTVREAASAAIKKIGE